MCIFVSVSVRNATMSKIILWNVHSEMYSSNSLQRQWYDAKHWDI